MCACACVFECMCVGGEGWGDDCKDPHQNVNVGLFWRAGSGEKERETQDILSSTRKTLVHFYKF